MSNVRIISSSTLQAANHQESSRIDLTPWDLPILSVCHIQKGLLFQKPTPDLQETLIHHLKVSLSETLDYFPPLAGRLSTVDHEKDDYISYFIDCNNVGALFIHATADSVTDLADDIDCRSFVIGTRHRLQELPESYFGNAIQGTGVTMKAKELLEQGIGKAAMQINRMIASMTEQSLKSFLVSGAASPRIASTDFMRNSSKVLVVNSSPRFNVYGNDFGWGKPIAVRSGSENKSDAMTILFCGAEEGSIDIEACLSPETLEAMGNDEEFMDTVA
ncbi:Transferase [Corchorus olitorius]|uniref:Transferase n=1 Tax=Corchorus olitorius TaxID=93759 RepID=A0A1R3GJC0_9ROSI|nr:Transferase [Corchorus olitorius]